MSIDAASPLSLQEFMRQGRRSINKAEENVSVVFDIYDKAAKCLSQPKLPTGLASDSHFTKHLCPWDNMHPESPERYMSIMDKLQDLSLIERCEKIISRPATREEVGSVHDLEQIDLLESTKQITDEDELESMAAIYDSIYFNQFTYSCAMLAAGTSIELVKAIMEGTVQNGLAIVRPPGHHASNDQYNGYCFFNNVAIAAQYALDKYKLQRILIVDWDVHHGQGTQRIFYENPNVLYFSIHRYEYGLFWPNLRESNFDFTGANNGLGYNVNVPLNETGCGDADYLRIFFSLLLPIAYEYQPELVLISAGYDAAIGCPEGRMKVTPGCYHHLTALLMGLASGRVAVILEGGYFLPSLSEGVIHTLKALLGDPAPELELSHKPKSSVKASILDVISTLRETWKSLNYFGDDHIGEPDETFKHKVVIRYDGQEPTAPFPTRFSYQLNSLSQLDEYKREIERLKELFFRNNTTRVGYCYDQVLELHNTPSGQQYEKPERIIRTKELFNQYFLTARMEEISTHMATLDEVCMIHTEEYVARIAELGSTGNHDLNDVEGWINVYMNEYTNQCALTAVGSLMDLVKAVIKDEVTCGLAIIRPPGHHAEATAAGGFCIFNNVAVAAMHALHLRLYRIMIIDWDIHHGNGIQHSFYNTSEVLYMSIHRHDYQRYYPHLPDANVFSIGVSSGKGYNINIPWNNDTMGDAEYISAMFRVVLPIAYQYNPEIIIIAAGFDAAVGDPLGKYQVTPEAFGHFVQLLKSLACGRIVIALEGGYNVNSVTYSMAMCCKALLGDPLPPLDRCGEIKPSANTSICNASQLHATRWKLLLEDITLIDERHQASIVTSASSNN